MPSYSFDYTPVPLPASDPFPQGQVVFRPYLDASIVSPHGFSFYAWIDSGADNCVFPISFAQRLGLDLGNMKRNTASGIGNSANLCFYGEVTVKIHISPLAGPSLTFKTYAAFTSGLEGRGYALFGQSGFFESFQAHFDYSRKVFEVTTR